MKQLMDLLKIEDYELYDELLGAAVCNFNVDKILVIKEVTLLEQVKEISYLLPSVRSKIQERMTNKRNLDNVGETLPLSKFLWDVYVIGLHDLSKGDKKFDSLEVAKIQRNRFAARKIIIEFKNYSELIEKFNQLVLPERTLDQLLERYNNKTTEEDFTAIEELLKSIDALLFRDMEEE